MVTLVTTEKNWANSDIQDLEREIIGKIIDAKGGIDEYTRVHPEVRWALGQGNDFFQWYKIRIHQVRNGNRYHAPGTGWIPLRRSRVARMPNRILEVEWSPVKIQDTPMHERLY